MKNLLITLLVMLSFHLRAQNVSLTNETSTEFVKFAVKKIVAPTLWGNCDYFDGYKTYLVYKSSIDKNTYLLGFDENDVERMKLKVDDVNLNVQLTVCYITYNGWTIRLYNRLD